MRIEVHKGIGKAISLAGCKCFRFIDNARVGFRYVR